MSSTIEICNLALSQIRTGSINSLDEASVQAQQCKLFFTAALNQLLNDTTWPFAHGIAALNLLTTEVFNWTYVWQYPSDCLRINRLIRNVTNAPITGGSAVSSRTFENRDQRLMSLPPVEYQIFNVSGNRVIATIEPDLRIDYRMKITDMSLLDVDAKMALVFLLASYLAIPLAGVKDGRQIKADCLAMYSAFKNEAVAEAVNEQHIPQQESEFITIRS